MLRLLVVTAMTLAASIPAWGAEQTNTPTRAPTQVEKSASERAWDELRWLMTALEAYAIDNDSAYAPVRGPREGTVADLDQQLEWYYKNTYPKRSGPPHVDPWGRTYCFVFSKTGKHYALYSLGESGKLGAAEEAFLKRVKEGQFAEDAQQAPESSRNVVVVSGALRFAPAEVLRLVRPVS